MSRLGKFSGELIGLMLSAADGSASADDLERLELALSSDEDAAYLFLCICQMESDLRLHESAATSTDQVIKSVMSCLPASDNPWSSVDAPAKNFGADPFMSAAGDSLSNAPMLSTDSRELPDSDRSLTAMLRGALAEVSESWRLGLWLWHGGMRLMSKPTPLSVTAAAFFLAFLPFVLGSVPVSRAQRSLAVENGADTQQPSAAVAARMTALREVQWGGNNTPVPLMAPLSSGQCLELTSGLAEITFDNGARVLLEGPSNFVVSSPRGGELRHGRLIAHVPADASGFSIRTPDSQIAEQGGAEFAIEVGRMDTKQEVHVFVGSVGLTVDRSSSGGAAAVLVLRSGKGIRVPAQGAAVEPILADGRRFAKMIDLHQVAAAPSDEFYVSAIKAARPLAYWRFEQFRAGMLANEMDDRWPLRISGGVRPGGTVENRHIVFPAGEADGWLQVDEPITGLRGDYSLEFWVKPDADIHASLVSLISPNRVANDPQLLHLGAIELMGAKHEFFPCSVIRLLHRSPPSVAGGIDIFSAYPYRLHSWHHIVAVKRGAELCLYVNGMLSAAASCDSSFMTDPAIVLGRLHTFPGPDSRRQFIGELDEVAVYGRALSLDEVSDHFEWGRKGEGGRQPKSASSFSGKYAKPNLKGAT